jgi:hypothetical protein
MNAYDNLSTEARELVLWADNTASIYSHKMAIVKNVALKIKKGIYDPTRAPKLWRYWTDAASSDYKREFGFAFKPAVRQEAAEYFATVELEAIQNGEYQIA